MPRYNKAQYSAFEAIIKRMQPLGYTYLEMAAACNTKEHVVERLVSKLGLTRKLRPWTVTKAQLQRDYDKLSPLRIAIKYDRALCHVYIKMKQLGIRPRRNVAFEKYKEQFRDDWMLLTRKELMVKYGAAVDSWRQRLGLPCRTTSHRSGKIAREA